MSTIMGLDDFYYDYYNFLFIFSVVADFVFFGTCFVFTFSPFYCGCNIIIFLLSTYLMVNGPINYLVNMVD